MSAQIGRNILLKLLPIFTFCKCFTNPITNPEACHGRILNLCSLAKPVCDFNLIARVFAAQCSVVGGYVKGELH